MLAISKQWLFDFDFHKLSSFHADFSVYASSSLIIENNFICAPQNIRGNNGVALFISKFFTRKEIMKVVFHLTLERTLHGG